MTNKIVQTEKNIRKYLDMYLRNNPKSDDFNTVFNLMYKIRELGDDNFVHDYPFDVTWELTSSCNLRCKHCYIQNRQNAYCSENDLSDEDMIVLSHDLVDYFEINHATLTGGEPFLRKNILDIIKILKNANVSIYIQTNGTLLNDKIIKNLSEILNPYMDIVQISLDGLVSDSHNQIRGKDIYEKVIGNIKKMVNAGIFVSVNCTITSLNYNEIEKLFLKCNDMGVKRFTVTKMKVTSPEQKQYEVSNEDNFAIIAKIVDLKEQKSLPIHINLVCFGVLELLNDENVRKILPEYLEDSENIVPPVYMNCHRREKISIKPDGKIYLCPEVVSEKAMVGDLKTMTLEQIWENVDKHPLYQFRKFDKMECKKCRFVYFCKSGCMGENFIKTGSIYSKSPDCFWECQK